MGNLKRKPAIGCRARKMHEAWSKATIHEALLDMWMEAHGKDCSPDDMTDDDWQAYVRDVERRSKLRQVATLH